MNLIRYLTVHPGYSFWEPCHPVKSREQNFYYGHPQNRFWKLLARICESKKVPETIEEKKAFLLANHIAVWDVIAECDIIGSSDSSIKNVVPQI